MSVNRFSGKFFVALLAGVVLSACSTSASTAVPPASSASPPSAAPPASAAPVAPLVTGLPDFTGLVERYGPAVVNVKVNEKPHAVAARGPGNDDGDNDNDNDNDNGNDNNPLGDFLRRFGVPNAPRGQAQPERGEGSGFLVTTDGYILTNAHVVRDAKDITVKLTDRREFPARLVGMDDRTDVAVIKIEAKDLPIVRIGDPSKLKPGQWVVAIGSPFGMENSVTAGIVSATSRDLPDEAYVPFIQTDAAVNPGNSGGPLFNMAGEVVGINSQIYSQSGGYMGLSFAIPIDMANDVREQLVKNGHVTRGKIGVGIQPIDADLAESFGLDRPRGALVGEVESGGPADKAGIRPGDIILSVDGRPVESNTALPAMISSIRPGNSADLELWSNRKLKKVTARVIELKDGDSTSPDVQGSGGSAQGEPAALGLTVRPLSRDEKQQVDTQGTLVVDNVEGAASAAGVRPGDIVLGVAGTPVRSVADLTAAIKRAGHVAPLLIQRGDRQIYLSIRKE